MARWRPGRITVATTFVVRAESCPACQAAPRVRACPDFRGRCYDDVRSSAHISHDSGQHQHPAASSELAAVIASASNWCSLCWLSRLACGSASGKSNACLLRLTDAIGPRCLVASPIHVRARFVVRVFVLIYRKVTAKEATSLLLCKARLMIADPSVMYVMGSC